MIGESGSGKTILARTILGLAPSTGGRINLGDRSLSDYSPRQWNALRRAGTVQYVFQDPLRSLDPDQTVGWSLAEPLKIRGVRSREEIRRRVEELAIDVNLDTALLDRFPSELSGGQRQRVSVARGLATEPDLLILDEPVSALDAANRVQVLQLLEKLRSRGISLIFISHDLGSVGGVTDRTVVLYRGEIVEDGPTRQVIGNPQHPYTRLLVGSAPTLTSRASLSTEEKDRLRAALAPAG
ncbi:ABC transporter ATP-binding protein [Citricoccus sp. NR2]|uniref:ABC transporter ATP-binding protein n=1 Tax=Citricoccus sp. NR2 TaxID=3004095 RepID=UPI0022DD7FA7|nr:ATP-binding cassette domain-containing protein [Citricoccus sp. NR2]WBL20220.1 ATP-binding cassette domain-containing protein [Citricoccus sp. NR2]